MVLETGSELKKNGPKCEIMEEKSEKSRSTFTQQVFNIRLLYLINYEFMGLLRKIPTHTHGVKIHDSRRVKAKIIEANTTRRRNMLEQNKSPTMATKQREQKRE